MQHPEQEMILRKRRHIELGVWIGANLLLIGLYFSDSLSIQCEPCPDNVECPPCQTDFMARFPYIIAVVNLSILVYLLIRRQTTVKTARKE
jgi:hypothetical protein